ncbi:GNAT family N-acetyltransferase [Streptomyces lydicus]|uniref:GNAT family N-acetyltransferase n=1 Tax=Streptomyces lydicus TaxID=47763 RepID=UPI0036CE9916
MTTELRVLRDEEWGVWSGRLDLAFGGPVQSAEKLAIRRDLTEVDRSLGVRDGPECVGTAGAFSFGLTVRGGAEGPVAAL